MNKPEVETTVKTASEQTPVFLFFQTLESLGTLLKDNADVGFQGEVNVNAGPTGLEEEPCFECPGGNGNDGLGPTMSGEMQAVLNGRTDQIAVRDFSTMSPEDAVREVRKVVKEADAALQLKVKHVKAATTMSVKEHDKLKSKMVDAARDSVDSAKKAAAAAKAVLHQVASVGKRARWWRKEHEEILTDAISWKRSTDAAAKAESARSSDERYANNLSDLKMNNRKQKANGYGGHIQ